MKISSIKKKYQKNVISGVVSLLLLTAIVASMMITGVLFASGQNDRVESAARNSYVFKTYLKGDDIQIHSADGVVTLTGTVASESHSSLAADTVADLPGVKSVDNRLEVKGGLADKASDAWIGIKVKTMFMLHRNVDGANTEVEVLNGRVTLRGMAGSHAERELASEYARDVEGVKEINNEMTVAQKPKNPQRTVEEFIDDSSIKAQIKLALAFHRGTSPFRTDITVKKGMVTVSGMAKNAAEKELVTKRIEDIHGVISIHNRMIIK